MLHSRLPTPPTSGVHPVGCGCGGCSHVSESVAPKGRAARPREEGAHATSLGKSTKDFVRQNGGRKERRAVSKYRLQRYAAGLARSGSDASKAARTGLDFFAAYPITPATEIARYVARHLPKRGGTLPEARQFMPTLALMATALSSSDTSTCCPSSPTATVSSPGPPAPARR